MSSRPSSIEMHFRADDALDVLRMRSAVHAFLDETSDDASDVEGALLVFGELVANVVRHAPGAIWVRFECPVDGPVTLHVDDYGPGLSPGPGSDDPLRENGRGIAIVRALARRLQIATAPEGTRISAELPIGRRPKHATV